MRTERSGNERNHARRARGGDAASLVSPGTAAGLFQRLRGLFGLAPGSVRDDIEDAIDESAAAEFSPQERAILKNVLALHDVRVADVMLPRADIVAISMDATLREILDLFRTAGHSRLPVYEEKLDDPRGMIYIRDLLVFLASDPRFGLVAGPTRRPGRPAAPPGSTCRFPTRASCGPCFTPRPRCRRSISCFACRCRARTWRW